MTHPPRPAGNVRPNGQKLVSGNYLYNAWYVAAWSDELAEGQLLGRTILKEPIVLYRTPNGDVAALHDRCAHRFAPLHMGRIVAGDRIQCGYHGLEFDASGACVLNPHGNKTIPSRARVRSFPAIEKHKAIWIWMGEKPPDESKVPDFSVLDNVPELYTTKRDGFTIRANYELIVDNLLDISHTSYLHEGVLGNADTVDSEITIEVEGDDVVVSRLARDAKPPGMNALMWPTAPERVDKFTKMRWMPPSTLRLMTGICAPGAPQESGTGYHAIHILTPESDRTTHYFFTAVRYNVMTIDEALNREIQDKIAKMRRHAFEDEDAPMIEAQQKIIDSAAEPVDPLTLAIDVGPVRYKTILQKMIAAEQVQ